MPKGQQAIRETNLQPARHRYEDYGNKNIFMRFCRLNSS